MPGPDLGSDREWPLVGRAEELESVAAAMTAPAFVGVFVAGEAGVGKTRLVSVVAAQAAAGGDLVEWVRAMDALREIPFGAVAHLVPRQSGGGDASALLREVAEELTTRAAGRRVAVVVDDAHLLDPMSAALVHHLAATGGAFVLATVRTGERAPEPVTALWKEGLAQRVEIQPLGRGDVAAALEGALGGSVAGATTQQLWTASGGNALFLHELVTAGLESGALAEEGGVWRWHGPLAAASRLTELIEARLGDLDAEARTTLEIVALGEPLPLAVLESMATTAALETLESSDLLAVVENDQRSFARVAHPLHGEVVRSGIGRLRARRVYRDLADTLEKFGTGRREDLLRVVTWRLESGERPSRSVLAAAAREAQRLFDHPLAERLASEALQEGTDLRASLILARARAAQGRCAAAEQAFEACEALAETDQDRCAIAVGRAYNLAWGLADIAAAENLLTRTEASVARPELREDLVLTRSGMQLYTGRPEEAYQTALDIAHQPGTRNEIVRRALVIAASVAVHGGKTETASELMHELASRVDPEETQEVSLNGERESIAGYIALKRGDLAAAARVAAPLYAQLLGSRRSDAFPAVAGLLSHALLYEGRPRAALAVNREALEAAGPLSALRCDHLVIQAQASAFLGLASEAADAASQARSLSRAHAAVRGMPLERGEAWSSVVRGEISSAHAVLIQGALAFHERRAFGLEADLLHDAVRIGYPHVTEAAESLIALQPELEGELYAAILTQAKATKAHDASGLEAVAARFEAMGANLYAAEAAAQAAWTYQQGGIRSRAAAAEATARRLVALCEGVRTPALALLDEAEALPLTGREREVAMLTAGGLASKEIAERLGISVRTVETHLQRVYEKLGVSGRSELAHVLGT